MRLCVAIPCFFGGKDFCEAIRTVASLGYDAAETYNWKSLDLDAVRKALDETGVELLSICTTEFNLTAVYKTYGPVRPSNCVTESVSNT